MITFNKILVCVDLSAADPSIIKNTCRLAKVIGTKEVTFLNVIKDFNIPDSLIKEFPDLLDKAVAERKAQLQEVIASGFDFEGVKTKILIKQGNATKEILTTSLDEKADLIVLGRKMGSNSVLSTRISRRAACNLLLIPEEGELNFNRIHVPVDFSNYSELALHTALALTHDTEADITLQNVYNVPSSYRYSGKTYEEFAEIMEDNSSKDLGALIKKVASVTKQKLKPVNTLNNGHNVSKLIFTEANKNKPNLIVMGAKGRTAASALFIGSKAERMIQVNFTIPLLVVREKGANAGIIESIKDI